MSDLGRSLPLYKKEVESACKDSKAVKAAKDDLPVMDVLVCGVCQQVFHLIYEFHEHKSKDCSKTNQDSVSNAASAQLWAFMLWKNSAKSKEIYPDTTNNLVMWRHWAKMDEVKRQTWMTAGSVFWEIASIRNSDVNQLSTEDFDTADKEKEKEKQGKQDVVKAVPISSLVNDPKLNPSVSLERVSLERISLEAEEEESPLDTTKSASKRSQPGAVEDNSQPKKAKTKAQTEESQEFVVEAIVGKRFHKQTLSYQYEIKWEGFPSSDNTWEPEDNLTHCKTMIAEYEVKKRTEACNAGGKPIRSSKAKAMDNLKCWTGTGYQTSLDPDIEIKIEQDDEADMDFEPGNDSYNAPSSGDEYNEPEPIKKPTPVKSAPKISKPQAAKKPSRVIPRIVKQSVTPKTPPKVVDPKTSTLLVANSLGMVRVNAKALPNVNPGIYPIDKHEQLKRIKPLVPKSPVVACSTGLVVITTNPDMETPGVRLKPRQPLKQLIHNKTFANPIISTTKATPTAGKSKAPIIIKNAFQSSPGSSTTAKQATFVLPPNPSNLPYLVMGTPGSGIGALLITPDKPGAKIDSKVDDKLDKTNEKSDKKDESEISLTMDVDQDNEEDMDVDKHIEKSTEPERMTTEETETMPDNEDKLKDIPNEEKKVDELMDEAVEEGEKLLSELKKIGDKNLLPEKPEEGSLLSQNDNSDSSKVDSEEGKSNKEKSTKLVDTSLKSTEKTQIPTSISPSKLAISPTKSESGSQFLQDNILSGPQLVNIPPGVDPTLIELPPNTQLMVSETGEYYLVPVQPDGSSLGISLDSSGAMEMVNLDTSDETGDASQTVPSEDDSGDKFVVVLPDGQLILVSDNQAAESVQVTSN